MAQWMGQFSGHTHATRVEDAEASLRHAVEVFRSTGSDPDREQKAKTVNRLAKRLMMARSKLMKARIAAAREVQSLAVPDKRAKKIASYNDRLVWDAKREVALAKKAKEIASLERKYAMTLEAGLDAILREFGAHDDPVL
jgi:hypothetical protein